MTGCSAGFPRAGKPARIAAAPNNELIRQTAPGRIEVGNVRLNQVDRTITFPAVINLREGPVEYLVVTDYGKIHESVLRTDIAPYHLQLALLLLLGDPAPPPIPPEAGNSRDGQTGNVPPRPPTNHHPPLLSIEIVWKTRVRTRRAAAGSFVLNRAARQKVGTGLWRHVGSRFRADGFGAQVDGSIISLIEDPDAIVGNALPGADDDDNWLAVGGKLPKLDVPVEVVITERPPFPAAAKDPVQTP